MTIKPEILYTTPTIYKGSTAWYIELYYWNDATSKTERVRKTHDLNRKKFSPNLKAKKDIFNQLLEFYIEELEGGAVPFNATTTAELAKRKVLLTLSEAKE